MGGGGHDVTVRSWGGGLLHTMVALKLQQLQYNLKNIFLRRLGFAMLLGQVTVPPWGGGIARGVDFKGGRGEVGQPVSCRGTRGGGGYPNIQTSK